MQILRNIEGGKNDLYGASPLTDFAASKANGIGVCTHVYIREDTVISAVTAPSGSLSPNFLGQTLQEGDIIVFDEAALSITFDSGSAWCYTANKKK
jgi:hypothetical protein